MCGVKSSQAGLLSSSYLGIVSPIYLAVILCCNKIPLYAKQLFYSSLYHLVMPILVPYPCGILPIMCLKLIHYINFWALLRYSPVFDVTVAAFCFVASVGDVTSQLTFICLRVATVS